MPIRQRNSPRKARAESVGSSAVSGAKRNQCDASSAWSSVTSPAAARVKTALLSASNMARRDTRQGVVITNGTASYAPGKEKRTLIIQPTAADAHTWQPRRLDEANNEKDLPTKSPPIRGLGTT